MDCMEDIDDQTLRGLSQQQVLRLASCDWIRRHLNVCLASTEKADDGNKKRFRPQGDFLAQSICLSDLNILRTYNI